MKKTWSQEVQILEYIMYYKRGITPIQALEKLGVFRLASRICELRRKGYPIETNFVEKNGKRFARYTYVD